MVGKVVFYIFYGLISGLGEILPVSAAAHGFLLSELTSLNTRHPLLQLLIHTACLAVLLMNCRHRLGHMQRELALEMQSPRQRKRQPDRTTVLDAKVAMYLSIPIVIMLAFSNTIYEKWTNYVTISVALVIGGIVIYVQQFKPGANRDSRHMSPAEAMKLGLFAGISAVPGFSRMGMLISCGLQHGCDKKYMLDIAFLATIPALIMTMFLDAVGLFALGFAAIDGHTLLLSCIAAVAAFGGAWAAVVIMRFLSMNTSYATFAYYSWGLGLFSFILYLMV